MNNEIMALLIPYRQICHSTLKPEQKICVDFANEMRHLTITGKLPFIWYHIPNEFLPSQRRNYVFDLKQKHMGKVSGTPDYCFVGEKSFFIEFKTRTGQQSPAQKTFQKWCEAQGIGYHICRSAEEGESVVKSYI
jgi:hypothetical protein